MKLKTVLITGLLSTLGLTQAGCLLAAAGAAGAGTYAYVKGEMSNNVDYSVKDVGNATLRVFADMNASVYENVNEGVKWHIYARTSSDHRIEVEAEQITEKASKVKVRVDNFGDETLSRDVMTRIDAKLKLNTIP
jgi:hypothetical protein